MTYLLLFDSYGLVFFLWGALSDERTGLSFVRVIACISDLLAPLVSRVTPLHGPHRKQSLHCCVIRGNVFIEPLPRNGFRNTTVL
jgi:hypothetical protein